MFRAAVVVVLALVFGFWTQEASGAEYPYNGATASFANIESSYNQYVNVSMLQIGEQTDVEVQVMVKLCTVRCEVFITFQSKKAIFDKMQAGFGRNVENASLFTLAEGDLVFHDYSDIDKDGNYFEERSRARVRLPISVFWSNLERNPTKNIGCAFSLEEAHVTGLLNGSVLEMNSGVLTDSGPCN